MEFLAVYGEYCGFITSSIIRAFEDADEANDWAYFAKALRKEQRQNVCGGLISLYSRPNHTKLRLVIELCGWTTEEYHQIRNFCCERSCPLRKGMRNAKSDDEKRLAAQSDLNRLVASTAAHQSMIDTAVLQKVVLAVLNDVNLVVYQSVYYYA
jgi:hypothetical protein